MHKKGVKATRKGGKIRRKAVKAESKRDIKGDSRNGGYHAEDREMEGGKRRGGNDVL